MLLDLHLILVLVTNWLDFVASLSEKLGPEFHIKHGDGNRSIYASDVDSYRKRFRRSFAKNPFRFSFPPFPTFPPFRTMKPMQEFPDPAKRNMKFSQKKLQPNESTQTSSFKMAWQTGPRGPPKWITPKPKWITEPIRTPKPLGTSKPSGDWRQAGLERHNLHRRNHGAPDLAFDPAVNEMAQKVADYLASKNVFGHKFGENLATSYIENKTEAAIDAVDRWYDEVNLYNYSSPRFSGQTGHFTQLVWKGSTLLGMGHAVNGEFIIIVGHYSPHGNMHGDFPNNVVRINTQLII